MNCPKFLPETKPWFNKFEQEYSDATIENKFNTWLYSSFNEHLLYSHLQVILFDNIIETWYENWSFFANMEVTELFLSVILGLESLPFHLNYDFEHAKTDNLEVLRSKKSRIKKTQKLIVESNANAGVKKKNIKEHLNDESKLIEQKNQNEHNFKIQNHQIEDELRNQIENLKIEHELRNRIENHKIEDELRNKIETQKIEDELNRIENHQFEDELNQIENQKIEDELNRIENHQFEDELNQIENQKIEDELRNQIENHQIEDELRNQTENHQFEDELYQTENHQIEDELRNQTENHQFEDELYQTENHQIEDELYQIENYQIEDELYQIENHKIEDELRNQIENYQFEDELYQIENHKIEDELNQIENQKIENELRNQIENHQIEDELYQIENYQIEDELYQIENHKIEDELNQIENQKIENELRNQIENHQIEDELYQIENYQIEDELYQIENQKIEDELNQIENQKIEDELRNQTENQKIEDELNQIENQKIEDELRNQTENQKIEDELYQTENQKIEDELYQIENQKIEDELRNQIENQKIEDELRNQIENQKIKDEFELNDQKFSEFSIAINKENSENKMEFGNNLREKGNPVTFSNENFANNESGKIIKVQVETTLHFGDNEHNPASNAIQEGLYVPNAIQSDRKIRNFHKDKFYANSYLNKRSDDYAPEKTILKSPESFKGTKANHNIYSSPYKIIEEEKNCGIEFTHNFDYENRFVKNERNPDENRNFFSKGNPFCNEDSNTCIIDASNIKKTLDRSNLEEIDYNNSGKFTVMSKKYPTEVVDSSVYNKNITNNNNNDSEIHNANKIKHKKNELRGTSNDDHCDYDNKFEKIKDKSLNNLAHQIPTELISNEVYESINPQERIALKKEIYFEWKEKIPYKIQGSKNCSDCGVRMRRVKFFGNTRYCYYSNLYYCKRCHHQEMAIIPAFVLKNWDFTPMPVCRFYYKFLNEIYDVAIYDLNSMAPHLKSSIERLGNICSIRLRLNKLAELVSPWKHCYDLLKILEIFPYPHLYFNELYSLQDLVNIKEGKIIKELTFITSVLVNHCLKCLRCKNKGFICEICKDPQMIYPYNLKYTTICPDCKDIFHQACFLKHREFHKCK